MSTLPIRTSLKLCAAAGILILAGCSGHPKSTPRLSSTSPAGDACGTVAQPCSLDGITVVAPRAGNAL